MALGMAFAPGTRLGVYEVVSLLGAGGMGEVYRAKDTKLGREVAVKILPPAFTNDPDRLARFRREAQVLASLNHPHIGAIYGLDEANGTQFLVLELVDGESLDKRIARGKVPVDEALVIAKQIAEALEAAHEKGIIHRDLKPANIALTKDGNVKVLDFGLAKATEPASGPSLDVTNSPTITTPAMMTGVGMILGTAAYMSPEQARGKAVDKRADIWAFGVVLFEMLSGRPLFAGDTVTDVLAHILSSEPGLKRLPATTPAAVRRLLARCLDKDPQRRLRDIGEARIMLERPAIAHNADEIAGGDRRVPLSRGAVAAVIALTLLAEVMAAWRILSPARTSTESVRLSATLPVGVTIPVDTYNVVAISPDGSRTAIVGASGGVTRIYVRTQHNFEARPLPSTEDAVGPFFSPDGAWIGFFSNRSLKKTPAGGGVVVTIAPAGTVRGAVWTDTDAIVYPATGTSGLSSVPASGGVPHAVTTLNPDQHERTHRLPSLLPDGKTVLFNVGTFASPENYDDATIEAVRIDTGARKVLLRGGRMPAYIETGDMLFVRGSILYAVPLDARRLELRGTPRPVIDGVLGDPTTGAAFYAVSERGTLAYIPGLPLMSARRFAWVDLEGKTTPIDLPAAVYTEPHVSPDGKRIAYSVIVEGSQDRGVWVADPTHGTSTRLTANGTNWTPIWSPDGSRVFTVSYNGEKNRSAIEVLAADGSGPVTQFGGFDGAAFLQGITPDGLTLLLTARPASNEPWHLYKMPAGGDAASKPVEVPVPTVSNVFNVAVSPDGRWLAYTIGGGGRDQEIFVQSIESGGGRLLAAKGNWGEPRWSADGRELFFVQNNEIYAVPIETRPVLASGRPRRLSVEVSPSAVESNQTYDVDPKSGRLLVMQSLTERPLLPEVRFILNWFTELQQRVPTRDARPENCPWSAQDR